ncbi:hypothetical protein LZ31DRAFT_270414 [Colletotrichum somersetense]|nr:hypothetical protein LZ31DRAFT_270414 [Colletotrichum somersetense]
MCGRLEPGPLDAEIFNRGDARGDPRLRDDGGKESDCLVSVHSIRTCLSTKLGTRRLCERANEAGGKPRAALCVCVCVCVCVCPKLNGKRRICSQCGKGSLSRLQRRSSTKSAQPRSPRHSAGIEQSWDFRSLANPVTTGQQRFLGQKHWTFLHRRR